MCLGTWAADVGTDARQMSAWGCDAGITAGAGPSTNANVPAMTLADEGSDSSCSDAAQQRSTSACVRTWVDPLGSPACIGQVLSSEQQAIRASGVGSHPAQTPT